MAVTVSNLAAALAAESSGTVNDAKTRDAGHPGVSHSLPPSMNHGGIPTPPNSISPTLPPHQARSPSMATVTTPQHAIESDIDLQESRDTATAQGEGQVLSSAALSGLEAAGAITPSMLSKHHLPDILLGGGPMAIRHIMAHLTQSVPGFSRIPPAKARRIVVSALEFRPGGGVKGDVLFEKVGWGRWDARIRGQPPREGRNAQPGPLTDGSHAALSPPASLSGSYMLSGSALQIPAGHRWVKGKGSWGGSTFSSRDDEVDDRHMSEHEADKMSLDGRDDDPVSTVRKSSLQMVFEPDDSEATDYEDWESIGPEALRKASYRSGSASLASRRNSHASNTMASGRISKPTAVPATQRSQQRKSLGLPSTSSSQAFRGMTYAGGIVPFQRVYSSSLSSSLRMQGVRDCGSAQERDAVEALLRMGSM